jgi:cytochrome c-type biogenesis protein CcmH/NrfG
MLYGIYLKIKSKLAWIGAALLAMLTLVARMGMLKRQRDRAKAKAEVLEHQAKLHQKLDEIDREVKKDLLLAEEDIKKRLKKKGKDFEGVDNLTNPDDY